MINLTIFEANLENTWAMVRLFLYTLLLLDA